MDTTEHKKLTGVEYESVNALFNIAIGAAFNIQNQGSLPYKISISPTKPALDTEAYRIAPADLSTLIEIQAANSEVWVLGKTVIHADASLQGVDAGGRSADAEVSFISANQSVLYSSKCAVDTSAASVTLTPDMSTGLKSFSAFDATNSFSVSNPCIVDFGTLTYPVGFMKGGVNVGGQLVGLVTLQTKNDHYLFYWDGQVWRTLDLITNDGGIA